jgi:hypothetical protein
MVCIVVGILGSLVCSLIQCELLLSYTAIKFDEIVFRWNYMTR